MDTASIHQWPQEFMMKPVEEMLPNPCTKQGSGERRPRPQKEQALNCPRCNSTNTKFCYYNNYSLTQPRYFCKTCRRYWTEGGSLRNIPVGGGSRKNKRSACPSSSSPSTMLPPVSPTKFLPDPSLSAQNPKIIHGGHDLNLGFSSSQRYGSLCEFLQIPTGIDEGNNHSSSNNNSKTPVTSATHHISALELLTGITSKGMNSFSAPPSLAASEDNAAAVYTNGFPMQEFKPTLNFSLDGFGGGYGNVDESHDSSRRLLFHFEDHFKHVPSTGNDVQQIREHVEPTGYWTGMLGGGSW